MRCNHELRVASVHSWVTKHLYQGCQRARVEAVLKFVNKKRAPRSEGPDPVRCKFVEFRSEEHTSELQSLMRISYAGFCLTQKHVESTNTNPNTHPQRHHCTTLNKNTS